MVFGTVFLLGALVKKEKLATVATECSRNSSSGGIGRIIGIECCEKRLILVIRIFLSDGSSGCVMASVDGIVRFFILVVAITILSVIHNSGLRLGVDGC